MGGSDAHTPAGIGTVWTAAPATTKQEYLSSLRSGTCAVGGRSRGFAALVSDVYAIVGQYYARLYGRPLPLGTRKLQNLAAATALLPATLIGVPAALTAAQFLRQEWIARFGPWARAGEAGRLERRAPNPLTEN